MFGISVRNYCSLIVLCDHLYHKTNIQRFQVKRALGAGEMAQWVETLDVSIDGLRSILETLVVEDNRLPKVLFLFWFFGYL